MFKKLIAAAVLSVFVMAGAGLGSAVYAGEGEAPSLSKPPTGDKGTADVDEQKEMDKKEKAAEEKAEEKADEKKADAPAAAK